MKPRGPLVRWLARWVPLVTATCTPELWPATAPITAPRVLAVKAEPAEAAPGSNVAFTALLAVPPHVPTPALGWRFCLAAKPITEDNAVAAACLEGGPFAPAGEGPTVTAAAPSNVCALFGPQTPPNGARPHDPDPTGGYYAPLRLDLLGVPDAAPAFYDVRLLCGLADASADVATAFARAYPPNENPRLMPLVLPATAPAGTVLPLTAAWTPESAEPYVVLDRASQALTTPREILAVGWYASAGAFEAEVTGSERADGTRAGNRWTAPREPGPVTFWVVLRDDRGGVDFSSRSLEVTW